MTIGYVVIVRRMLVVLVDLGVGGFGGFGEVVLLILMDLWNDICVFGGFGEVILVVWVELGKKG